MLLCLSGDKLPTEMFVAGSDEDYDVDADELYNLASEFAKAH